MKIDTNSDGSIDWEEFMNFILLENENLSYMRSEHAEYINPRIPDPHASIRGNCHNDLITQLLMVGPNEFHDQKYFTSSQDGTVKIWNAHTMVNTTTINVSKNWVTAMAHLSRYDKLAAASSDRSISFYDLNKSNETISNPVSKLSDLKGVVNTLDYVRDRDLLIAGDDLGAVRLYRFGENWHVCNTTLDCHRKELEFTQNDQVTKFMKKHGGNPDQKLKKLNIKTHVMEDFSVFEPKFNIHDDMVTKVEYLPDIDSIFSCAMDKKIKRIDLETLKIRDTYHHHKKGLYSFAWCRAFSFIASCGEERHVTIWNPHSKKATITYLPGHNSAIVDLELNNDKCQLISLSDDKVVKIWDIRTYHCIQTITDKTFYRPENRLSKVYYNPRQTSLLLTSKKINVWPFKAQEELPTSHDCKLTGAIFNKNFNSVISTDEDSNVHVWSLKTGKIIFKYSEAHDKNRITTLCIDDSQRRLVTGSQDGSIKMWNFNNGFCIREFNYDKEPKEVSKVIFIGSKSMNKNQYIISVGWDRHVYVWPDENEPVVSWIKCLPESNQRGHTDDIISLAYCEPEKLIITGGHKGQLMVWHFETGFSKGNLHEKDPSLLSRSSEDNKAIEELIFCERLNLLMSFSSNGYLRFWDLHSMSLEHTVYVGHFSEDLISCASLSPDEGLICTGDESGNVKIWEIVTPERISEYSFFNVHTGCISSLQIFEPEGSSETFLLTTGSDKFAKLFTIEGNYVGYFGQHSDWNIFDSSVERKSRSPKKPQKFFKTKQDYVEAAIAMNYPLDEELKEEESKRSSFFLDSEKTKPSSRAFDVFRSLKIEKLDHVPNSQEEAFRMKTGKMLNDVIFRPKGN